jgi:transcription initiation factor IIE alpha subunit
MATTTLKETTERACRVLECLATGPKHSTEIAAATGLGIKAVINALTGLRRAGAATMTDHGRPGKSWYVWTMAPKCAAPIIREKGITAQDLAWMQYWRDHAEGRQAAVRAARGAE